MIGHVMRAFRKGARHYMLSRYSYLMILMYVFACHCFQFSVAHVPARMQNMSHNIFRPCCNADDSKYHIARIVPNLLFSSGPQLVYGSLCYSPLAIEVIGIDESYAPVFH